MTLALKRIKVYVKLTAIVAVIAVLLLLVLMNREYKTNVWFFKEYAQVNVLWLLMVTAVFSIAGWWIVAKVFATIRELREVRQAQVKEQVLAEQRRLAQELADREKRIDEKLRRSITEE
ncbi:MAG: hypothetical protein HRF43_01225 [Phycisphaerae bacterium]|jgi:uncharacterized membrane protein